MSLLLLFGLCLPVFLADQRGGNQPDDAFIQFFLRQDRQTPAFHRVDDFLLRVAVVVAEPPLAAVGVPSV